VALHLFCEIQNHINESNAASFLLQSGRRPTRTGLHRIGRKVHRMAPMISYRSVVDPSDCDFLGHMNVSKYFAACSDGVFAIQSELGLTANDMRNGRRLSFAVVHAESDFKSELSAGDAIRLETGSLEVGSKSITFRHRLIRSGDEAIAFETIFKCVMLNLESRRAEAVPDAVRASAQNWMVDD
jgi:acyl-CoA thioester hydrolase